MKGGWRGGFPLFGMEGREGGEVEELASFLEVFLFGECLCLGVSRRRIFFNYFFFLGGGSCFREFFQGGAVEENGRC